MIRTSSSPLLHSVYHIYLSFPAHSPIFKNRTCRVNCIPISFFLPRITKWSAFQASFCAVSFTLSTQFKSLRQDYSQVFTTARFRNILVTQWNFNPSSCKSYCLTFTGFIFIPFSAAHSPMVSRSFCNLSVAFHTVMYLCRQIIKIWSIQLVSVSVAHIAYVGNDANFLLVCLIAVNVGPLSVLSTAHCIVLCVPQVRCPAVRLSFLAVCPMSQLLTATQILLTFSHGLPQLLASVRLVFWFDPSNHSSALCSPRCSVVQ